MLDDVYAKRYRAGFLLYKRLYAVKNEQNYAHHPKKIG
ncbi:hypothetical protein B4140_3856 [Bacillus amyloliquefaciens]|nr:hypothetical protein B4140_3856 [Bacillus amyloliquefaciens]